MDDLDDMIRRASRAEPARPVRPASRRVGAETWIVGGFVLMLVLAPAAVWTLWDPMPDLLMRATTGPVGILGLAP